MIRIAEFKPDLTTEDQNKPGDLKDDVASLKRLMQRSSIPEVLISYPR